MKRIKGIFVAGFLAALPSISVFATPLDITFTGDAPVHHWNGGVDLFEGQEFAYEDLADGNNVGPATVNFSGVNSIQVTWNAPAGYMYVVNPPPSEVGNLTLAFEAAYGLAGQASSLGSITSQNISVNTIYGTSPISGGASLDNNNLDALSFEPALDFRATATISPNASSFAFNSITITADFSGTGSTSLQKSDFDETAGFFGVLYGIPTIFGVPNSGPAATDPGQLWTLEPLPTGSVPEVPSTFFLAGMSFTCFWLCRRKLSASNS